MCSVRCSTTSASRAPTESVNAATAAAAEALLGLQQAQGQSTQTNPSTTPSTPARLQDTPTSKAEATPQSASGSPPVERIDEEKRHNGRTTRGAPQAVADARRVASRSEVLECGSAPGPLTKVSREPAAKPASVQEQEGSRGQSLAQRSGGDAEKSDMGAADISSLPSLLSSQRFLYEMQNEVGDTATRGSVVVMVQFLSTLRSLARGLCYSAACCVCTHCGYEALCRTVFSAHQRHAIRCFHSRTV